MYILTRLRINIYLIFLTFQRVFMNQKFFSIISQIDFRIKSIVIFIRSIFLLFSLAEQRAFAEQRRMIRIITYLSSLPITFPSRFICAPEYRKCKEHMSYLYFVSSLSNVLICQDVSMLGRNGEIKTSCGRLRHGPFGPTVSGGWLV